ncbi:MAG: hypothetical protein ACOCZ6_03800 [Nanoarchaeota archaeon]
MAGAKKKERNYAALAYLLVGIVLFYADEKINKSKFVKHHVKQSINLWVIFVAIQVVAKLMLLLGIFVAFLGLIFLIGMVVAGVLNSLKGKKSELPVIGALAEKYLQI